MSLYHTTFFNWQMHEKHWQQYRVFYVCTRWPYGFLVQKKGPDSNDHSMDTYLLYTMQFVVIQN